MGLGYETLQPCTFSIAASVYSVTFSLVSLKMRSACPCKPRDNSLDQAIAKFTYYHQLPLHQPYSGDQVELQFARSYLMLLPPPPRPLFVPDF